jgi:serine/threonine protein kinase
MGQDEISDEQLFSWVDRNAPELSDYLRRFPEARERVEDLRSSMGAIQDQAQQVAALPAQIGPYRILSRLGAGGMGVVYEAEQKNPDRCIALKVLRGIEADDADQVKRFQREAQIMGQLQHPYIATVFEAGQGETGEHYLAMERVEGQRLLEYLEEQPYGRSEQLLLFQRICEAIEYAHDHSVIHRDLKPSNILIDAEGRPKVLDFGLARMQDASSFLSAVTRSGRILGTLPYMSPEQAQGSSEIDERSDVYSLGVILYQMLTGNLPLNFRDVPVARALQILAEDLPPPASHHAPELRGDLDTILLQALEKHASQRYSSVHELSADVGRYLQGEPISARRSFGRRLRQPLRRHRATLLVSTVALALLLWAFLGPEAPPPGAEPPSDPPEVFEAISGKVSEFKVSPFEGLRWRQHKPQVLVEGKWYELEEVQGIRTGLLLEYCKQTSAPRDWRKRFAEDFGEVLHLLLESDLPSQVSLHLRDPQTRESRRLDEVELSSEKRQVIWSQRQGSPFAEVRDQEDGPEFRIGDEWYEIQAIEGHSWQSVRGICQEQFAERAKHVVVSRFVDLVTALTGDSPEGDSKLSLRRLSDGHTADRQAPLTQEYSVLQVAERRASWSQKDGVSGYPTRAPFDALRFAGNQPVVRIGQSWWQLLAINDLSTEEIVNYCQQHFEDRWQRRFGEDLVAVLFRMDAAPGGLVELRVRGGADEQPQTLKKVAMTEANRAAVRQARVIHR